MGLFSWLNRKTRPHEEVKANSNDTKKLPDSFDGKESSDSIDIKEFLTMEATMSGPFTSGNLSMYLIHGADLTATKFMTLEEALDNKKVVIEETGAVSRLRIKNDGDEAVFIQSGDIVKGGKQDRTLQHDMILNSNSGFVQMDAFCVESGRWCKRGAEDERTFSDSHHYLSSKPLRMAARRGTQNDVWKAVDTLQTRSANNAGVPLNHMQDAQSQTSLHLTLDSQKMQECTKQYIDDLTQVLNEKKDVLGCAFAINGEMNNIDVYSCNSLLKKMGAKLIKAAAVEAFSEQKKEGTKAPPTIPEVVTSMRNVAGTKSDMVIVNGKAEILMQESEQDLLFETRDLTNGGQWLHRSYTAK